MYVTECLHSRSHGGFDLLRAAILGDKDYADLSECNGRKVVHDVLFSEVMLQLRQTILHLHSRAASVDPRDAIAKQFGHAPVGEFAEGTRCYQTQRVCRPSTNAPTETCPNYFAIVDIWAQAAGENNGHHLRPIGMLNMGLLIISSFPRSSVNQCRSGAHR